MCPLLRQLTLLARTTMAKVDQEMGVGMFITTTWNAQVIQRHGKTWKTVFLVWTSPILGSTSVYDDLRNPNSRTTASASSVAQRGAGALCATGINNNYHVRKRKSSWMLRKGWRIRLRHSSAHQWIGDCNFGICFTKRNPPISGIKLLTQGQLAALWKMQLAEVALSRVLTVCEGQLVRNHWPSLLFRSMEPIGTTLFPNVRQEMDQLVGRSTPARGREPAIARRNL